MSDEMPGNNVLLRGSRTMFASVSNGMLRIQEHRFVMSEWSWIRVVRIDVQFTRVRALMRHNCGVSRWVKSYEP